MPAQMLLSGPANIKLGKKYGITANVPTGYSGSLVKWLINRDVAPEKKLY